MVHIKHLKKGDLLLREGDHSTAMYWVQSGTLRLFKKKGNGFIELGVIHSGEVVGEMSFLDNEMRSASIEAIQPCDIVEIPRGNFDEFINTQPAWMKSLMLTLVKRLRTTSNRLRELESASTVYAQDEDGNTVKQHEFLSTKEVLKLCEAMLVAGTRNSEKQADGSLKLRAGWLQLHGGHILGIQVSKITIFTDLLQDAGWIRIDKQKDHVDIYIPSIEQIERFMFWTHEENMKPVEKQMNLSSKAMAICDAIHEFGALPVDVTAETHTIDMAPIFQKSGIAKSTKLPFEWASFEELTKADLSKEIRMPNDSERLAEINLTKFLKLYPFLALRQRIKNMNAQKRGDE